MIELSETAKEQAQKLIKEKAGSDGFLRLGVKGGGCSGLSYTINIDDKINEFDKVFEHGDVKVVCDQKSFVYLNGITIDFSNELVGGGFNFKNPNADGSCGCGISFSM